MVRIQINRRRKPIGRLILDKLNLIGEDKGGLFYSIAISKISTKKQLKKK
ncbi:MAG: hypothetical protein ACMUEL_01245 [Flavobacteriales bacterium Tduv]